MKKWTLIKESTDGATKLWYDSSKSTYSIWRNKGAIHTFESHYDVVECEKTFDELVEFIQNGDMTLGQWLKLNNYTLTELELDVLDCIRSQGSFYEEAAEYDDDKKMYYVKNRSCFFGWQITEEEVPGCRGALSSLVKKGILDIVFDDSCQTDEFPQGMQAYFIKFTPIFNEDGSFNLESEVTI